MSQLHDLIGVERELSQVGWAVREFARQLGAAVVGGHHVTCSDEAESECADAFQRWFAAGILPELKPAVRSPFRTTNLGGRYEWGSVAIGEQHFAGPRHKGLKLMVLKINSHVAVRPTLRDPEYGWLTRYGQDSPCCGALEAMLRGAQGPAMRELAETFAAKGKDRAGVLREARTVPVEHRALLAAIVNARLQAERAVSDIGEHRPSAPTVFLVLPCATINRPGPDTEIVVGEFGIDWTESSPAVKYAGLGDDPAGYRVRYEQQRAVVADAQWPGVTASARS